VTTLESVAREAQGAAGTDAADAKYAAFAAAFAADIAAKLNEETRVALYSLIAGVNAAACVEGEKATLMGLLAFLPRPAAWNAATMMQLLGVLLRDQMQSVATRAPPRLTLIPGGIVDD
jgi:hypothetical protein